MKIALCEGERVWPDTIPAGLLHWVQHSAEKTEAACLIARSLFGFMITGVNSTPFFWMFG